MSNKRIRFPDSVGDFRYVTGTDGNDDATNDTFVVAEDLKDNSKKLLQYDPSTGEWFPRGTVNMGGSDITNVGSLSTDELYTRGRAANAVVYNNGTEVVAVGPDGLIDSGADGAAIISNALNTVQDGSVYITGGFYDLSGTITVPTRTSLIGAGREAVHLRATTTDPMIETNGASHLEISGLELNGQDNAVRGLNLINTRHSLFSNLFITQTTGEDVNLAGGFNSNERSTYNHFNLIQTLDSATGFRLTRSSSAGTFTNQNWFTFCHVGSASGSGFVVRDPNSIIKNKFIGCSVQTIGGIGFDIAGSENVIWHPFIEGVTGDEVLDSGTENWYEGTDIRQGFARAPGSTRPIRNGLSENNGDPRNTGDWNGVGWQGIRVFDTANSVFYEYANGAWRQL